MPKTRWILMSLLTALLAVLSVQTIQAEQSSAPLAANAETLSRTPHNVWIIGDSLTGGLYASTETSTFRSLLFAALQNEHPAEINATFWSWKCTLAGLEKSWESYVGVPDLLFIELGINDLARTQHEVCPLMPVAEWQSRYGAMLDRIRAGAPGVKIIVGTIPWSGWNPNGPEFAQALVFNDWIKAEAAKRDIVVADLWAATVGKPDGLSTPDQPSVFPPGFRGDNFHPNDIGHRRIAETFFQTYQNSRAKVYLPYLATP